MQNDDWAQTVLQKEAKRKEEFEKKFPKREQLKLSQPGTYTIMLQDEGKKYSHPEYGDSVIFNVVDLASKKELVYFAKNEQLLASLAKLGRPLTGKTIRITRSGKGIKDTNYTVELANGQPTAAPAGDPNRWRPGGTVPDNVKKYLEKITDLKNQEIETNEITPTKYE